MNDQFAAFISGEALRLGSLPLLHATDGHAFRTILNGDQLQPTHCDVYDEDLLYFFYGRPSYRVSSEAEASRLLAPLPVCLVLREDAVAIWRRLMPFDSGAYNTELYKDEVFKKMAKEDFELPAELATARRLVSKFYETNRDYIHSKARADVHVPPLQFEAEAYRELLQVRAARRYDDRCSAVEVQADTPVELSAETVIAVVGPEPILEEPMVKEAVVQRWGAQLMPYDYTRMKPSEYTSVVLRLVTQVLENCGYL